jgi:hypothetical protein
MENPASYRGSLPNIAWKNKLYHGLLLYRDVWILNGVSMMFRRADNILGHRNPYLIHDMTWD